MFADIRPFNFQAVEDRDNFPLTSLQSKATKLLTKLKNLQTHKLTNSQTKIMYGKQEESDCRSYPLHHYRAQRTARHIGFAILWLVVSAFGADV